MAYQTIALTVMLPSCIAGLGNPACDWLGAVIIALVYQTGFEPATL